MTTFPSLKSSDRTIKKMQRFGKSHQTWFAMKKNKKNAMRLGSWMKMSNVRLKAVNLFFGKVSKW